MRLLQTQHSPALHGAPRRHRRRVGKNAGLQHEARAAPFQLLQDAVQLCHAVAPERQLRVGPSVIRLATYIVTVLNQPVRLRAPVRQHGVEVLQRLAVSSKLAAQRRRRLLCVAAKALVALAQLYTAQQAVRSLPKHADQARRPLQKVTGSVLGRHAPRLVLLSQDGQVQVVHQRAEGVQRRASELAASNVLQRRTKGREPVARLNHGGGLRRACSTVLSDTPFDDKRMKYTALPRSLTFCAQAVSAPLIRFGSQRRHAPRRS